MLIKDTTPVSKKLRVLKSWLCDGKRITKNLVNQFLFRAVTLTRLAKGADHNSDQESQNFLVSRVVPAAYSQKFYAGHLTDIELLAIFDIRLQDDIVSGALGRREKHLAVAAAQGQADRAQPVSRQARPRYAENPELEMGQFQKITQLLIQMREAYVDRPCIFNETINDFGAGLLAFSAPDVDRIVLRIWMWFSELY